MMNLTKFYITKIVEKEKRLKLLAESIKNCVKRLKKTWNI